MRTWFTVTALFISIFCFSQYQSPAKSSGESVNTSYHVGTLPGEFGVSGKGAARYSIPIMVAPGTAGLIPHLAISYNSHCPNGILGMGWELEGLSEITRVGKDYYHDNTTTAAALSMDDVFAIDSVRLILVSGTHPLDGAVYAREYESFDKITARGSLGNGPEWFELQTKEGAIIEYGKTFNSRVEAPGTATAYRWRVNRIKDTNGNYIDFIYNEDSWESTIGEIRYTGNESLMLSPYNRVVFTYTNKNDPSFYYIGGSKIPQTKLLTSITIRTEGDQLVREYTLKYHYDFYTHLNEVYETGSDGTRINSTIFQWGVSSAAYSTTNPTTSGKNLKFFHGDFNGDGITDLLYVVRKSSYSSSDQWTIKYNEAAPAGPYTGNLNNTFKDFVVVDANSDGKDEVLWRRRSGSAEYFDLYGFNGSVLNLIQSNYCFFTTTDPAITLNIADFDGDGDKDYMALKTDKNLVGFQGFTPTGPNPNFNTPNQVHLLDFNGDRKTDILVIKNNESYIYSYNPIKPGWDTIYTNPYPGNPFPISTDRIYTGDFNGDQKTDILYYRAGWKLSFSDGLIFQASTIVPALRPYDPGASPTDNNYFIGDFNGDKKDDIVEMYGTTAKNIDVFYSKGDGSTIKEVNSYGNYSLNENYFSVIDYNSDGQMDIWRYDYVSSSSSYPIISFFHKKERRDLISSIRNGLGYMNTIVYENLNYRLYDYTIGWKYLLTKGAPESFPLQDISCPLVVVKESTQSDGIGGVNLNLYTYEGAKRHLQGKGFLGFTKQTITGIDERYQIVNSCDVDRTYYFMTSGIQTEYTEDEFGVIEYLIPGSESGSASGKAELSEMDPVAGYVPDLVEEPAAEALAIQSNTYTLTLRQTVTTDTIINYGSKRIFIAPKQVNSKDANNPSFRTSNYKYSNVGNVIRKETRYYNSPGGPLHFKNIQSFVYGSFGSYGINNRITQIIDTSIYSGDGAYVRIDSLNYD